jgi:hypothetical protein
MPPYPTLMECRRFHSTHKVGPWTPLTSNPSNALSAVLKTGGNGGWLTAVARWHMRYSLRRISWRRHDRASGLCANPFALSRTVFGCDGALCIVWPPRVTVTHIERSRACNLDDIFTQPSPCHSPSASSLKVPPALFASSRPAHMRGCAPS